MQCHNECTSTREDEVIILGLVPKLKMLMMKKLCNPPQYENLHAGAVEAAIMSGVANEHYAILDVPTNP